MSTNTLLGENGIIEISKDAKKKQDITMILEELELEKGELAIKNYGKLDLNQYLEHLKEKGIITESNIDRKSEEKVIIIVEEKYAFIIEKQDENNIKIEYIENPEDVEVYTITYYANDGTDTIVSQSKTKGEDITLRNGTGFGREGYKLVRWNTSADGNGTSYELGATYSENAALTLYAIWEITYYTSNAGFFDTLAEAVEATSSGDTIKAVNDITDTSVVTINKDIIINPNGKTITMENYITVNNGCSLKVVGEGIIQRTTERIIQNSGIVIIGNEDSENLKIKGVDYCITNSGIVELNSGILECSSVITQSKGRVINGGSAKIFGGKIIAHGYGFLGKDLEMTAGEIDSQYAGIGVYSPTDVATINISGGTIIARGEDAIVAYSSTSTDQNRAEINISGATEIEAVRCGILVNTTSTVTIGSKTDPLNTTSPSISTSGQFGVSIGEEATFNFYNGVISGTDNPPYSIRGTFDKRNESLTSVYDQTTSTYKASFTQ